MNSSDTIFQKQRGFTLVELLVVIAIIGLLSSVVLASLNSARAKARDTERTASIRQVQTALELYYHDNRRYITSADAILHTALASLAPTYIGKLPINDGTLSYRYYNNSQNPAMYYAIYIPYETKPPCYVCAGTLCQAGVGWWGVPMCQ